MSAQALDQHISSAVETPRGSTVDPRTSGALADTSAPITDARTPLRAATVELLTGLAIGIAVVLTAVGVAVRDPATIVVGVVLGVAAAFVLASRGMGETKVPMGEGKVQ